MARSTAEYLTTFSMGWSTHRPGDRGAHMVWPDGVRVMVSQVVQPPDMQASVVERKRR